MSEATSTDPSFDFFASPGAHGLYWRITFPPAAGNIASLVVSTGNGPESVIASAGTLTGTDPVVTVAEITEGGLRTELVSPVASSWHWATS